MRPVGRVAVRPCSRTAMAPHSADGQRHLFFNHRAFVRICAQLHGVCNSSRAVRNWDGRRMGRRCFAGDGGGAGALAWNSQRNSAKRLFHRFSSGFARCPIPACRLGDGARCSGSARCPRSWHCTFERKCRSRKRGSSTERQAPGRCFASSRGSGSASPISSCSCSS